ncbi:S41 family peptidase [Sinomicrobium sp. M5D2P17]
MSKFWQEVNYNFVYLDKIDREAWEEEYKKLITEVQETENDYEYYRLLQKFCAMLKDGHTNVNFPKILYGSILLNTYFGEYRIFLSNIDGKAIITRVNASKKEVLPIGTEIVKVNGMETKEYIKEHVAPYISSSTEHILKDWSIRLMLRAPEGTGFHLEFRLPDGSSKSLRLTHTKTEEKEVYPPFEEHELLDFKWLENDIAYVALNSFSDAKIDTLFTEKLPELYKAKKLVIDLRNNGGGSTSIGTKILQYLTNDTLLYGSKTQSRLHIPSFKAWGKWTEAKDTVNNAWAKQEYLSYHDAFYHDFPYEPDTVKLKEKRIVVPTVLLIGHNTASAAEDFLIYADNQQHMVKIGEPTFGSTGQPLLFDLPGGGSARVCTKKDTYPDGREFVGYGIQPDITVKKTLSDYLKNKDPALEEAIRYLNRKN